MDAYGREVRASDYRGVPVLISTGACWCGGCQSRCRAAATSGGEIPRPRIAVDSQRVLRQQFAGLGIPEALPAAVRAIARPDREFENRYNRDGWPFFMLADQEGKVVFRKNHETDWQELTKLWNPCCPSDPPSKPSSGKEFPTCRQP